MTSTGYLDQDIALHAAAANMTFNQLGYLISAFSGHSTSFPPPPSYPSINTNMCHNYERIGIVLVVAMNFVSPRYDPSWLTGRYLSMYRCMYLCMYLCVSMYISMYVSMYVYVYIYISIYVSIYVSIYLSMYLSMYLSIYLSIYLSLYLSVCLSIRLSICVSVCL